MKNSIKAVVVGLFAILGVLVPNLGANAAPADAVVVAPTAVSTSVDIAEAPPCGFFENAVDSYYGHCGPTWVKIRVDRHNGQPGYDLCVPPSSLVYLGSASDIANAYYIGLC
ncbi:DUF6355 family natural product biosynthesis protein [Saccharothrix sp. NRRL B-16348]|uniref:DUF6355 family natural product biosynthesis protein n=1 Tax=Saccharothrix sp. NRRL B-16348 TaxID=1415542 RepID=UPI0006AD85BC|nr:DUF6355 family natural product biosynthesis protein [Saccharothrix sp. NRRL B-16348]